MHLWNHLKITKSKLKLGLFFTHHGCNCKFSNAASVRDFSSLRPEINSAHNLIVPFTSLPPNDHTTEQIGMWYRINPDVFQRVFADTGITVKFRDLHNTIMDNCFMIRQPALTILNFTRKVDLSKSPNRFLLYGKDGAGKTMSLAHVLHAYAEDNWLLVHIGVPARWMTLYKEIIPSTKREGFYDHTVDAAIWLKRFSHQNELILKNPELVTSESYQWTAREETPKGSHINVIIEFGISRAKYASECVFVLLTELKRLATDKKIKMAVVIDGINSLFADKSTLKSEDRLSYIALSQFTLVEAFLQLTKRDWTGGVIVGSVDVIMSTKERRKSHLPRYLLGRKGWDALDPFLPIPVPYYTAEEFNSAVNFYIDRKWIQHPNARTKEAKDELAFVSARNPKVLMKLICNL